MSLEETNQLKEYFDSKFDQLNTKVDKISRGMYGEEENKVPGITARVIMLEQKVKKLFNDRARVIWVGSAFVFLVGVLVEVAKWYFK